MTAVAFVVGVLVGMVFTLGVVAAVVLISRANSDIPPDEDD
jgi:hypothetical protein